MSKKRRNANKKSQRQPKQPADPSAVTKTRGGWLWPLVKVFTVGSVMSLLALLIAVNQLQPNLVIEEVIAPDEAHQSETRFKLKNNGTFSLANLDPSWAKINLKFGTLIIADTDANDVATDIPSLSPGEHTFISAMPSIASPVAEPVTACDYDLTIRFRQRFMFLYGPETTKSWRVVLRAPANSVPQWDVKPIELAAN